MLKKGQAWGIDLVVGLLIFTSGILFFYFYAFNNSGSERQEILFMQQEAKLLAGNLFTSGTPNNWNSTNVIRIGITDNGRINQTKIEQFYDLDYQTTKTLFGIIDEYYVEFPSGFDSDGDGVNDENFIGDSDTSGAENLIVSERVVVYQNKIVSMRVVIWN